ncbi:hypothetical protein BKA57DRAFT_58862 [Linnemannia elongata]|nr:hypothetical protein BKA57DRAFT_58862 [Linnemannia elongata]
MRAPTLLFLSSLAPSVQSHLKTSPSPPPPFASFFLSFHQHQQQEEMVVLKQILSSAVALLATLQISFAAPAPTVVEKRSLSSSAPLASDINGAHLLLLNDVDSETSKNAFLLLSAPRGYYDGMSACSALGDGGYIYIPGTAGASNLVTLLNNNAVAQKEVSAFSQFWVYNGNHPLPLFPTFHVYLVLVFLNTRSQYSLLWLCSLDFFSLLSHNI